MKWRQPCKKQDNALDDEKTQQETRWWGKICRERKHEDAPLNRVVSHTLLVLHDAALDGRLRLLPRVSRHLVLAEDEAGVSDAQREHGADDEPGKKSQSARLFSFANNTL